MIGELLVKINILLSRNPLKLFWGVTVLIGLLSFGVTRLSVTESIYATLPKGKAFQEFNHLVESKSLINQIVFSLEWNEEASEIDPSELVSVFKDSLSGHTLPFIANIITQRNDIQEKIYNYTLSHFPILIDSGYLNQITPQLQRDSVSKSVRNIKNQLLSPGAGFVKEFLLKDPVGITFPYFQKLNLENNSNGIVLEEGIMFDSEKKHIIITASTAYESGNSQADVALFNKMNTFQSIWNKTYPNHHVTYFGTFEIAARNALQIKKDTFYTSIVAVILILLLFFWYYKKRSVPLLLLLPGIFGGLFALGITGFIQPEISGISLAMGAVIFGILLDYSIHFFTHYRHTGSISQVIREVSAPLLTGSFTTILAFSALTFAKSKVLVDFGFFATLGLIGASLFTVILLPVILQVFRFDFTTTHQKSPISWPSFQFNKKTKRIILLVVTLLTGLFLYEAQFTQFDNSFENLSIHNQELKNRENELTGLNPIEEKRIYIFARDPSTEKASTINFQIYNKLQSLRDSQTVTHFNSTASFVVPHQVAENRIRDWKIFWESSDRRNKLSGDLHRAAAQNGFEESAFSDFNLWLLDSIQPNSDDQILAEIGMQGLVDTTFHQTTFISPVTVPVKNLESVKTAIRSISGAEIFDRGELAESLLTMVKDDFNYILFVSAAIVFFTLLIVYGRIELALLTFIPMVISWIWILGIAAILGIKFNFVNVIITTFIFGLGDDFSIFVTDGLLTKYKTKKDSLNSYRSAILLSATTTMIGTGCLIFAKHPAIYSIAIISVLGIVCILIISFVVQPILFDLLIQNRVAKQKKPIPLLDFIISVNSFIYFFLGCLILHSHLVTILFLPISKKRKRSWINSSISFFAKTVIYSGPHVKKNLSGLENLNPQKPVIFIANHSSFLDILLTIMLNPKMVMMVKGWVYKSPFFGPIIRYAGYIYSDNGPEQNLLDAKKLIEEGYSILIFPEGTRSINGQIGRFHKGAFHLAEELGIAVQPIMIQGAAEVLPKKDFLISSGQLNVKVLPPISIADPIWGENLRNKTKNIAHYFKENFEIYEYDREDTTYLRNRIFSNYIFKGPVLEWYFKVKWRLESNNYAFYERNIRNHINILDIGCGYGYLSFFLHYKNKARNIIGIDYDAEKISIASNSYNKSENLNFINTDIMSHDLQSQDVIFLNDVLHYLSAENQRLLLQRCIVALLPGGILFIRDGITDRTKLHSKTELTEKLSTGILGFNKKKEAFHYFHSDKIFQLALEHNLEIEMNNHSTNTSNVLFILKKPNTKYSYANDEA